MTTADVTREVTPIPAGPLDLLRHSWVLAKRSLVKTWRTPEGLIDVTLAPIMFTLLFTFIFGGAIAGSTSEYLVFLIPGLIGQNIAFSSVGIGIQLNSDMEKGIFDRFRSLPISRISPLLGAALGDIVRYVLLIGIMVGTGSVLGYRITTDPLSFLAGCLLAILFALSLAWAPMLVGLVARSERAVQGIVFMTLFPLTFASNAFVDPSTMPSWLEAFSNANPLSHLIESLRALWSGTGEWQGPVTSTLVWCAILVAIFAPLAIRAYNRKT
ncbi:ABC transporter permease [Demequina activiva]|uniref:Transport permease protein n=1 Tax=Demequina activiva TaxID=1582364 RepID=A0A919UKG9_9MICO|nr:ABC transporter permease [Demequina activiva]GIG54955.1 transport permease protein [Demequina activiva]